MSAADRVVAIVLAAGLSRRFGGDKLLHPWHGKPLAAHVADTIGGMGLDRIAVCPAGDTGRAGLFAARGFRIVRNPDPEQGMGTSLALGAADAISIGARRVLVCLADMPNVTAAHLLRLLAAGETGEVVATLAGDVRSPPAVFAWRLLPQLAALSGDTGARQLMRGAALVEADAELTRDFDTPGDFERV